MGRISNWFKNSNEESKGSLVNVLSLYRNLQSFKSKEDYLKIKKESLEEKLNDITSKINREKDLLAKALVENIQVDGKTVLDIIYSLQKKGYISFNKSNDSIDCYTLRILRSKAISVRTTPGYTLMWGEVTDSGHLVICPDKENCEEHRLKSLFQVGVDLSPSFIENNNDSDNNNVTVDNSVDNSNVYNSKDSDVDNDEYWES